MAMLTLPMFDAHSFVIIIDEVLKMK